jgi:multisubunit Na+/H+ antiporter MnhB subunit
VSKRSRIMAAGVAALGGVLVGVGIVYLTVACENLPGVLGPTAGETSPRTPLGVICVVLGVAALLVALALVRRRPPGSPAAP